MKSAQLVVASLVGLAACVSAGCGSNSPPATADSGVDHPGSTSDTSVDHPGSTSDTSVDHPGLTTDAADSDAQRLPTGLMSPPQTDVACSGSDTTACTLPPSACALYTIDGSASYPAPWVVYYQMPRCENGHCVWEESYFQCQNGSSNCYNGGCQPLGTTTAIPVQ